MKIFHIGEIFNHQGIKLVVTEDIEAPDFHPCLECWFSGECTGELPSCIAEDRKDNKNIHYRKVVVF